jgi:hypothetical protein
MSEIDSLPPDRRAHWDAITNEYNHVSDHEPSSPERSQRLFSLHESRLDVLRPERVQQRADYERRTAPNRNLSGLQFFHGTAQEMRPGTRIRPASQTGRAENFPTYGNGNYAYAADNVHAAHRYADLALSQAHGRNEGYGKARRVYEVAPLGDHEPDPDQS